MSGFQSRTEGAAKIKGLLKWCKECTRDYDSVNVTNMTSSWRDGLAFCAIIHHFRPELIRFSDLKSEDVLENNRLAFSVAEEHLGIPALLDPEDMVEMAVPDKLCVITYVSQFYVAFKNEDRGGGGSNARNDAVGKNWRDKAGLKRPAAVPYFPLPRAMKKRGTLEDMCCFCRKKVYIMERHLVEGKLYHRVCYKESLKKDAEAKDDEPVDAKEAAEEEEASFVKGDRGKEGLVSKDVVLEMKEIEQTDSVPIPPLPRDERADAMSALKPLPVPRTRLTPEPDKESKKPPTPVQRISRLPNDEGRVPSPLARLTTEPSVEGERERKLKIQPGGEHLISSSSDEKINKSDLTKKIVIAETKGPRMSDEKGSSKRAPSPVAQRQSRLSSKERRLPSPVPRVRLSKQPSPSPSPPPRKHSFSRDSLEKDGEKRSKLRATLLDFKKDVNRPEGSSPNETKETDEQSRDLDNKSGAILPENSIRISTSDSSEFDAKSLKTSLPTSKLVRKGTLEKNKKPTLCVKPIVKPQVIQRKRVYLAHFDIEGNVSVETGDDAPREVTGPIATDSTSSTQDETSGSISIEPTHDKAPSDDPNVGESTSSAILSKKVIPGEAIQDQTHSSTPTNDSVALSPLIDDAATEKPPLKFLALKIPPEPTSDGELSPSNPFFEENEPVGVVLKSDKDKEDKPDRTKDKEDDDEDIFSPSNPFSDDFVDDEIETAEPPPSRQRPPSKPPRRLPSESGGTNDGSGSNNNNDDDDPVALKASPVVKKKLTVDESLVADLKVPVSLADRDLSVSQHSLAGSSSRTSSPSSSFALSSVPSPARRKSKRQAPPPPAEFERRVIRSASQTVALDALEAELARIDVEQQELEERGVALEQRLRGSDDDADGEAMEAAWSQWFDLVNRKNELFRREMELYHTRRMQELEDKHSEVEREIRVLGNIPDAKKTARDRVREARLIEQLVSIVNDRNRVVDAVEQDRRRQRAEDHSIQLMMERRGLTMAPGSSVAGAAAVGAVGGTVLGKTEKKEQKRKEKEEKAARKREKKERKRLEKEKKPKDDKTARPFARVALTFGKKQQPPHFAEKC